MHVTDRLCAIAGRGSASDAERRAAAWIADDLAGRGHEAWIDTYWLRPRWAAALALGAVLAAAGSLVSVAAPLAGAIAAGIAAIGLALEALGRSGPLRVLSRRRATQNVVSVPDPGDDVTLIVCAPYSAPRRGLVLNDRWRAAAGRLGDVRAWLAGAALVVAATSAARLAGIDALWLGFVQLLPTIALIAALAAALDIALSEVSPGADTASAAAVALAVHEELTREPPAALHVGLLLYGAADAGSQTLRAQLRRGGAEPRRTVLLELGPCTGGSPGWRTRHPQLRRAAELAAAALELPPARRRPRPPRVRRVPALRIACLDARGIATRSHQPDDTAEAADPDAATAALDLALGIADALDAELARRPAGIAATT